MTAINFFDSIPFDWDDQAVLAELLAPALGQVCVRVEESFDETVVLGLLRPQIPPTPPSAGGQAPAEICSWLAATVVSDGHVTLDERTADFAQIMGMLEQIVGQCIDRIAVDPADLHLTAGFANGISVSFVPDFYEVRAESTRVPGEIPHWFVIFPGRYSVGIETSRHWSVEDLR